MGDGLSYSQGGELIILAGEFRCRYCKEDRHPGCHATCPKYAEDLAVFNEKKAKAKLEHDIDDYRNDIIASAADYSAKHRIGHAGIVKPIGGK